MNTELNSTFINAVLADASYVDGFTARDTGAALQTKLTPRLTEPLAAYIASRFEVVTQYTESNFTASGLSVTVWNERASGQLYMSFRGTEGPADFLTDGNLAVLTGLAQSQVRTFVNWYLRATAAPGADVMQLRSTIHNEAGGKVVHDTYTGYGEGTLSASANYTVNGHSLGGHLTTAFTRLFGGNVQHSNTFNGAGMGWFAETMFSYIENTLGLAKTAYPDSTKQTNHFAEHGLDLTTNNWWFSQIGTRTPLFNEEGTGIPNHLMYKMTDALALCDVMGRVDGNMALSTMVSTLDAASANAPASLEIALDALRKIFLNDATKTPVGDDGGDHKASVMPQSRIDYHTRLAQMRDFIDTAPPASYQLVSLATKSADAMLGLAKSGNPDALATRYALKELNPFAVLGDISLYARFNTNHELDLYSAEIGRGLSNQWIEDRAKFLAAANTARGNDSVNGKTLVVNPAVTDTTLYTDQLLGVTLRDGQTSLDPKRIAFGTEFGDSLRGGNLADHLYGAAGADTLTGNAGADHLEGGLGDDVLHGGAGSDTYWIGRDGGTDTLLDSDGQGRIVLNGTTLEGTLTRDATDRGRYHYAADPDLVIRHIGAEGMKGNLVIVDPRGDKAKVMVMDWASGELGLTLSNTPATPIVRPLTLAGDLLPIDHDISTPEENLGYDVLGNVDVTLTAAPGRADTLYGSAGNDLIQAKGGDDVLAGRAGEDRLEGGDGVDILDGGADNDLLIGGLDADLLGGGTGDDRLFADAEIELADIDLQTGGSGRELLVGGEGNDILAGAATSDALLGGAGDDVLLGGTGDDDLVGDRDVTIATRDWSLTRSITTEGDITRYRHTYANFSGSGEAAESGADVLYGGAGNDWIFAGAGDDLLEGEADADVLFGEAGHDVLDGGAGDDIINGDEIDDGTPNGLAGTLHGSDWLDGGDGADTLTGNGGSDELYGGTGNDQIAGDDTTTSGQYHGADYLDGEDGNDRLWGNGGEDSLFGGEGNDHLEGDESRLAGQYHGADYLDGEAGDDVLAGDDTADAPLAANHHGNDLLDGGEGWDSLYGNGGDDTMEDSGGPPTTRDSRRWRYGDSKSRSANQDAWRAAA